MMRDFVLMSLQNFRERKLRSWLTMIGIFIGIAAVVAIVSLGQGLQAEVDEQFSAIGGDKLFLSPGGGLFSGGSASVVLDESDRTVIEGSSGVRDTLGVGFQNARVSFQDETSQVLVNAYTLEDKSLWDDMFEHYLLEGRMLERGDEFRAIVGYDHTQDEVLWDRGLRIGDRIMVDDQEFTVVGVQEKLGNSIDDRAVHMSSVSYEQVFDEDLEDDYQNIIARVDQGADPNEVADNIENDLRSHRGVDEGDEDFMIQTTEELTGTFNDILLIVNIVIAGIGAISLLVGGIGIMNTMYTAVVERTQEIGIMKAIGARNRDVMLIFLIESGLLGLVGGIVGVLLGLGVSWTVSFAGALTIGTPYLQFWWSWWLVLGAILFSVVVGGIAGLAPAYQASRKNPVESLRYE